MRRRPCRLRCGILSGFDESVQEEQVRRLAQAEVSRRFDLQQDPMLRVGLVVLSEEHQVVLFTQHHIASDGWSMGILVREPSALYERYAQGLESLLPALPVQYADYAAWQRQWLQGEVLTAELSYWKQQLSGIPVVHSLPLDHVRGSIRGTKAVRTGTDWMRS